MRISVLALILGVLIGIFLIGCSSPEPRPLSYGEDNCDYCKMTITDQRYGSELVTSTGKIYTFDSVECLAAFVNQGTVDETSIHSLWVTDFKKPSELVSVEEAFFLHSPNLRSPMGLNLTAFGPSMRRDAALNSFAGDVLAWSEVRKLVREESFGKGSPAQTSPRE